MICYMGELQPEDFPLVPNKIPWARLELAIPGFEWGYPEMLGFLYSISPVAGGK